MPPPFKPKLPFATLAEAMAELTTLRDKAAAMPQELGAIFAAALRSAADELAPQPEMQAPAEPPESGETAIQRLEDFFRDRDNAPATINQMCEGTGIRYQMMRTFIYNRHKDKFLQVPLPMGRAGQWRWAALEEGEEAPAAEPPKPDIPKSAPRPGLRRIQPGGGGM